MSTKIRKQLLEETQKCFYSAILGPRWESPYLSEFLNGIEINAQNLSPEERLEIYANAWYQRLEESLREDYSVLNQVLGCEAWNIFVNEYIREFPSQSYTLAHASDCVPNFLMTWNSPFSQPWHADLALIERAYYQVSRAPDPPPWKIDELQKLDLNSAEMIQMQLQTSVKLIESQWNFESVWKGTAYVPREEECQILIYRLGFSPLVEFISSLEAHLLRMISANCTLGELLENFPDESWIHWLSKRGTGGVLRPMI